MDMDMGSVDVIVKMEQDLAQILKATSPAPQLHDDRHAVAGDHGFRQAKTGLDDCVAAALTPVETWAW